MNNAWRGENWTAIEKAAALLAWHFGYGSGFGQVPEPQDFAAAMPWRSVQDWNGGFAGNENTPGASPGIHFGQASETIELARNAIHRNPKKWPQWVCELPDSQRAHLLAWSEAHPFPRGMPVGAGGIAGGLLGYQFHHPILGAELGASLGMGGAGALDTLLRRRIVPLIGERAASAPAAAAAIQRATQPGLLSRMAPLSPVTPWLLPAAGATAMANR